MADESIQERQDNELEALKAIYGGQLQETPRTKGTKGWRPLDIVLSLGPQQGSVLQETHTCLDLHIICGNDYPNTVPKITVVKSKGLTIHQLNILVQNLNKKADTLKGEVMVFELATMVQTYLHQYNRPGFQSLYDEMFSRQLKEQQKEEEQKKVLEDKMRQEVLLETQNKKEALKQEQRWRRNSEIVKEEEDDFLPRTQTERQPVFKKPLLTADLLDNDDSNEMKQADSSIDDFTPWTHSPQGVSRLKNEFEVLQFVGKGAFGDVLKVRNKLDRCLYAIKRIELNPMNKLLYKKITREVKLLSRLNHENVVRYFNSWIETDSPDNISCTSQAEKVEKVAHKVVDMLPINDVSVEWDLSKHDQDSSDDSSDDNCWITFLSQSSETTGKTLDIENSQTHESISSTEDNRSENVVSATQQFMYIQMEFCEKSTLRTAIDNGLYKDENRVWRLLREIVEGLSHIHEQGIIHRDLKPVNIFIDSEDHVKIGDFGLATTNILHKAGAVVEQMEPLANHSHGLSVGDISHTGQVGTALYVAPELNTCCIKATYNQKVDIYSLGVIFFEMCYNPLFTHMERIKVLADLRSDECQLPADFVDDSKLSKTRLLRWMLLHDPLQRPSSEELLQSELLPPPQFEERELQELMRRTLNNPQSKLYKYLVASCFSQEMSTAQDVTYDMSVSKGRWFVSLLEEVIKKTRKVLETHGAVSLSPPLLVPCGSSPLPPTTVSVMTRWGGVVKLPHDLRLPFARFLAHNPAITQFKRYSIDRVYRERRVLGHHPRELYECAFDIVTPNTGNMVAESELLSVVWQVLNEYPSLLHNCVIRLNHTNLLRAILFHCGIEVTKHNRVCSLLAQVKEDYCSKPKVEALLSSLDLAEQTVSALMNLLDQEHTFGRAVAVLLPVLQRSNVARTLSKQAFNQLELIISSTLELGVKCPLVVSPGLVGNCNHYSSGMICQVVWEHRNKQGHNQRSIIAAGGRYDNLISTLRQMNEGSQCQGAQNAVGISLSLDKLVTTLQADQVKITPVDAVVCSVGSELMIREKLRLTRELWAAGIRTYLLDGEQNLEEIQTFCLEVNIPHIIMLKDTDIGSVRIRSWNKDRFYEKKVAQAECVDNILRLCETQNSLRPETKSVSSIITEVPTINIVFLLGEKLSSAMKRRYEYQVHSTILSITHRLSPKVRVEVIVVNMEGDVIKMLASYIEMDSYDQDLSAVIKRFPKHKKLVNRLSEQIQEMKRPMIVATIVLYGTVDNTFKVLL